MLEERTLRALPAPESHSSVPATVEYVTLQSTLDSAPPEPKESIIPLSHYVWILRRHKWRIAAFVVFCVVATVVVSGRLTPIYEATASLDIDRQAPAGFIGQDASRTGPNDADQFLATQVKTIQSDSVLRPVAERFKIPAAGASASQTQLPASRLQNAPIVFKNLKVTRPANTYLLLVSYRSPDPEQAADVANGIAESYIQHTYDIRFRATAGLSAFMEKQIEELKAKMERSSAAQAQFEKDLSVINPEEKTSILSARLLQISAEFTTAQADRVRKQAAFDSVKTGSEEAAQASTQGQQLRALADRLDQARERFAVVKTQYGAGHPEYGKALSLVTELERQFATLKADITQTGRPGVPGGGQSRRDAEEYCGRNQSRIRSSQCALFRIQIAQARSRCRQNDFMTNWSARSKKPASTPASRTAP